MKKVKILVMAHVHPKMGHNTFMLTNKLFEFLKLKINLEIVYLITNTEKIPKEELESNMYDMHDYNNAVSALKNIKPDIIFDVEYPSLIDLSISFAAKFLDIPVVTRMDKRNYGIGKIRMLQTHVTKIFTSTAGGDTKVTQKKFLRRGRYFVYKYLFLLKTLRATGVNYVNLFKYSFIILKVVLTLKRPFIDVRFANTLHWLPGENLVTPMKKAGFDEKNFVVTGHPIYDEEIEKFEKNIPNEEKSDKIRVLFLPVSLYEGGFWTKKERDYHIQTIVKEITKHKEELSLFVKIHPSSMILYEYEKLVHEIDPSIEVIQKGYAHEFLDNVDVVIDFPSPTNADMFSLLARKPIIMCNFLNFKGYSLLLDRGLSLECKNSSHLYSMIKDIVTNNPATDEKIKSYFRDYFYKTDGKSTERLANAVLKLIEK